MPLDLVVSDLLAPAATTKLRLRWLEKWIARADCERVDTRGASQWLASAFSLPSPAPIAAISLAGDAARREGAWLRADPVHLRIERDSVILHHPSILEVTAAESEALVAALQDFFRGDGLEFLAPVPGRWYVRTPEGELPETIPLEEAMLRNVFGLLPRGGRAINWGSVLTEAQMLLAGHKVNAGRERAGKPAINSVWFWGEGALPPRIDRPYDGIYADEPFARGLACLSDIPALPPLAGFAALLLQPRARNALVVIDALGAALGSGDLARWSDAAQTLDAQWFAHLGEAAARFGALRLVLPSDKDTLVARLRPTSRWRWFRSARPLATHA